MLSFQQDFPGTTLIKLEQNYRSTQVILDAANGIIAENARRLGKTLFTAQQGGEPVTLLTAADERDEAEWLAGELSRRAADGDMAYEGMAILYRTNAQSRPLEEAFRFRGIPYRLVGAVSFYERREVKDVLAYLRLIANPADDEAFARIVNVPRRGIGDASFTPLVRAATQWGKPLLETARAAERIPDLRPNVRAAFAGLASSGRSGGCAGSRVVCSEWHDGRASGGGSRRSDGCATWDSRARAKNCISHGRGRGTAPGVSSCRSRRASSRTCRRARSKSEARRRCGTAARAACAARRAVVGCSARRRPGLS